MSPLLSLSFFLISLLSFSAAQDAQVWSFPEVQLQLTLPAEVTVVSEQKLEDGMTLQRWETTYGKHALQFELVVVPRKKWGLRDPFDVLENIAYNRRLDPAQQAFRFEEQEILEGPLGPVPFAAGATAGIWNVTERIGTEFFVAGLTENKGYSFRLQCTPTPDKKARAAIFTLFRDGVRFTGKVEDPRWAEEDALARWERDRPEEVAGDMEIYRTDHYIIFTNSSSGKKFAIKMEECYEAIQETFPFAEIANRRLMPVFLFRTREEYIDYYAKIANISKKSAANSKGHAWRDYYATYYDSPVDPVHVHEATHQIFSNRLKLGGGGSWFQEGVAEYMSTKKNERKGFARTAARKGGFTPFHEFVTISSLLQSGGKSKSGENLAHNHYLQAASMIDFLRNSKFGKPHFDAFLKTVGRANRGDVVAIEAAIQQVYEVDLAGLEAEWVEYWD